MIWLDGTVLACYLVSIETEKAVLKGELEMSKKRFTICLVCVVFLSIFLVGFSSTSSTPPASEIDYQTAYDSISIEHDHTIACLVEEFFDKIVQCQL